jgi:hypothetical protein
MFEEEEKRPAPMQVSTVELGAGCYSTQLCCQFPDCTEIIQVELTAQGVAHASDYGAFDSKDARFFVIQYLQENGRPFSTALHLLSDDLYPKIEAALRRGDPDTLFTLNKEYVPFYCKRCRCVYCYQHMDYEEVWDEDYVVGGVDYWRGTCPYGHRQFVDH